MLQFKDVSYLIDFESDKPKLKKPNHDFKVKTFGAQEDIELTNGESSIYILTMSTQSGDLYITMVKKEIDSEILTENIHCSWEDEEKDVRKKVNKVLAEWTEDYVE